MNVRDLTIVLRPRSNWEAVDLGTALAKRYFRDLFRMGLLRFGPFFVLLAALCWKLPFLLPVLIWWLKPLLDRFYLYYLSRRIFGQEVTVRETWSQGKSLWKRGSLLPLTWHRFSPARSMTLAVSDLEGLKGAARSQRSAVVTRVGGGHATLVTLGGVLLELIGVMTLLILGRFFIPQGQAAEWDAMTVWFGQGGVGQTVLTLSLGLGYGLIVLLLEPIYLASGFALYLNSRTSQEAWDIELRFRELAARVKAKKLERNTDEESRTKRNQAVAVLLSMGLFFFGGVSESQAASEDPQQVVEEVLKHEDFTNHVEKYKEWVPDEDGWWSRFVEWLEGRGSEKEGDDASRSGGAEGAFDGLFKLLGILALALLAGALVVLMVHLLKGRTLKEGPKEKGFKRPPPKVVLGMEVTPESLPDDLLAQAQHYWQKGQQRLAMSLIYRGALTHLIVKQEVSIEGSHTESECLKEVEAVAPKSLSDYFRTLSAQWMRAAYSKEQVTGESFEQLCSQWPFERRTG